MRYLVNPKHWGMMVVTEIRRPEPEACLTLVPGDTVEISNDEHAKMVGIYGPSLANVITPVAVDDMDCVLVVDDEGVQAKIPDDLLPPKDQASELADDEQPADDEAGQGSAPSEQAPDQGENVTKGAKRGKGSRKK